MTAQPPLPLVAHPGAVPIGAAAAVVQDEDGGRVFVHGQLVMAWAAGDEACRRLAAVQLVTIKAALAVEVAAGFGIDPETLRRWGRAMDGAGAAGLVPVKPGPKGPSVLTPAVVADIRARRARGASLRVVAAAVGVSTDSVRRAEQPDSERQDIGQADIGQADIGQPEPGLRRGGEPAHAAAVVLPVLPAAADRSVERVAARFGLIEAAAPVFAPAARVPLAGLLLALPALEVTGLLACAGRVFGALPNGFYGLDTVLLEAVLRTLAGQARAEAATRIDPAAFGRVLGLDRAPEVKTIRRKLAVLAGTGKADRLLAAMAATHLARPQPTTDTSSGADGSGALGVVLYVDGHVRAYQGTRRIGKTHLARLRFPAPATLETWVSDAHGDPVMVVMAQPGASLAGELRRLMPQLRAAVGDQRRVLVGFDRGGWSPALFAHLHGHGFDVLTWRKGPAPDIAPELFTDITYREEQTGREHTWHAADTTITLPLCTTPTTTTPGSPSDDGDDGDDGDGFTMRQVTLAVPARAGKHGERDGEQALRQIHILTTRTDLPTGEVIHRMGSRWRQENYFRYARMHFELDAHDCYTAGDDDPARLVPNPAKKRAYQAVVAARARHEQAASATDAALLQARSPKPGVPVLITNEQHDKLTTRLREAQAALAAAEATHAAIPARLPLAQVNPGQQVLDVQTKLITHAIRIAAFNTAATLARELRIHTGYARKNHEAHTLIRQALTWTGDIDPTVDGMLTIRLDPLPTARASTALAELCEHLTATRTRYPGTDLILRYEIKTKP